MMNLTKKKNSLNKIKNILITGGAGFVGHNLALQFEKKKFVKKIVCLDNFQRNGSLNNKKILLKKKKIKLIKFDCSKKFKNLSKYKFDLILHCASDPSVNTDNNYKMFQSNLMSTINLLEFASEQKKKPIIVLFSSSRVYSINNLKKIKYKKNKSRLKILNYNKIDGLTKFGINEKFSATQIKSFYGSSKFSSEQIFCEYSKKFSLPHIINRYGIITGPRQLSTPSQGIFHFWLRSHIEGNNLCYTGFGGRGIQVRDAIDIEDVFKLLIKQLNKINNCQNKVFNIGGGLKNTFSLRELTNMCNKITGKYVKIKSVQKTHSFDIPFYVSDCSRFEKNFGKIKLKSISAMLKDIYLSLKS